VQPIVHEKVIQDGIGLVDVMVVCYLEGLISKLRKKTTERSSIFYREAEIALSYRAFGRYKHWRAQLKIH